MKKNYSFSCSAFGGGCPYDAATQKTFREQTEAQMKPTLDVQKGYELIITEQTKEVTLNTFKSQLGPKMKYYTNAYKTEFI